MYHGAVFKPSMLIVAAAVALAPMQCQSKQDPELRRYETPGDALYALAQQFRAQGNDEAYRQTLRFLVARYPSSRHAVEARLILEQQKNSSTEPSR